MKSRHVAAALFCATAIAAAPAAAQTYVLAEDDTVTVETLNITVGEIEDMDVVNAEGEEIGEVEEVLMEGTAITAIAVEAGGFLGIGEKTVAVPLGQVTIQGDDLMTNLTKEELEALPEWED